MTTRLTLRSNTASLQAQRRLGNSTEALWESFTRLSSGLRINKASDDAAGLSIASSLETDRRVYQQGVRNLNDAISLINIAETALGELSSIATRIGELSEQSANGTLSDQQRVAIQTEVNALVNEYNRILDTTSYNNQNILDGSYQDVRMQGGYGVAQSQLVSIGEHIFNNYGDGTFSAGDSLNASSGSSYSFLDSGDINGDGITDIVARSLGNNTVDVFIGNSDGSYQAADAYVQADNNPNARILINDLNNDGYDDLAMYFGSGSPGIHVRLGQSDGSLGTLVGTPVGGTTSFDFGLGDITGDGTLDLIVASGLDLRYYSGDGDGTFSGSTVLSSTDIGQVEIADLNNDGRLDFIAGETFGSNVHSFINNGDGTFSSSSVNASRTNETAGRNLMRAVDINGDGNIDAVTVDTTTNEININLGDGTGSLGSVSSFAPGVTVDGLDTADLNSDGAIDIIVLDQGGDAHILLNSGDGSFGAPSSFSIGTSPTQMIVSDFDNDGVNDIATTNGGTLEIQTGNSTSSTRIQAIDVSNQAAARSAIEESKELIENLALERANIGATVSRLTANKNNIEQSSIAYGLAASKITDADIALESAQLVKQQILQQAGLAILGQANQIPQLVLRLLSTA